MHAHSGQTQGRNLFSALVLHCLLTDALFGAEKTAARYRWGYYYASYRAHITHSLYHPTVRPPIIWILIPCYERLCTITTISHPTTGKTERSCVVRRTQICSLCAVWLYSVDDWWLWCVGVRVHVSNCKDGKYKQVTTNLQQVLCLVFSDNYLDGFVHLLFTPSSPWNSFTMNDCELWHRQNHHQHK